MRDLWGIPAEQQAELQDQMDPDPQKAHTERWYSLPKNWALWAVDTGIPGCLHAASERPVFGSVFKLMPALLASTPEIDVLDLSLNKLLTRTWKTK